MMIDEIDSDGSGTVDFDGKFISCIFKEYDSQLQKNFTYATTLMLFEPWVAECFLNDSNKVKIFSRKKLLTY